MWPDIFNFYKSYLIPFANTVLFLSDLKTKTWLYGSATFMRLPTSTFTWKRSQISAFTIVVWELTIYCSNTKLSVMWQAFLLYSNKDKYVNGYVFRVWIKIHVSAEQCHEETDWSYITNCFAKVLLWDFFCCFITSLTAGDVFQTMFMQFECLFQVKSVSGLF